MVSSWNQSALAAWAVLALSGVAAAQDDVQAKVDAVQARIAELEAELAAAKAELEVAQAEVAAEEGPKPEPAWNEGWEGSVAVGLNGSDGNTETLSFRVNVTGTRVTERYDTTFGLLYSYQQEGGNDTENRFLGTLRNDWKFKDSPWRLFALGQGEIDEFQEWDARLTGIGGVGYQFLKNDKTSLVGRAGAGASYELGGGTDDLLPEGYLALDFTHKLTERQSIEVSTEYFPRFDDLGEFRWINRVGYSVMVDPESNLFLKAGVEHRHNSDPGEGFESNDVDYFLTLGWSF